MAFASTPTYYLGVDPGKTTGLCLVRSGTDTASEWSCEVEQRDVARYLRHTLDRWLGGASLTVVMERFIVTGQTARNSQATYSLEVIGIVRQALWDAGFPDSRLVMQTSSQGKIITNEMLRALQLWHRGGKGHANDAFRHVLARMLQDGFTDERLLGAA